MEYDRLFIFNCMQRGNHAAYNNSNKNDPPKYVRLPKQMRIGAKQKKKQKRKVEP